MSSPPSPSTIRSRPAPTGVEVWRVSLAVPPTVTSAVAKFIPPGELARINSFKHPEAWSRQLLAHAALRSLLGERLNVEAQKIRFRTDAHGKPMLAGDGALHFNLSHSGNLALIAISASVEVGVDVEHIRPIHDLSRLAGRFFTPREAAALAALPEPNRPAAFFRSWTRKEAVLKATGLGIANGLRRVEVSFEPAGGMLTWDGSADKAAQWTLHTWSPAEGYVATVAAQRPGVNLEFKEFEFENL